MLSPKPLRKPDTENLAVVKGPVEAFSALAVGAGPRVQLLQGAEGPGAEKA
ncbi:hypothetical protein OH686_00780 [Pseudomonas sp. SO81]|nr:hypothetical protein OH686_00780 [Pseudomonas sp. SO81]